MDALRVQLSCNNFVEKYNTLLLHIVITIKFDSQLEKLFLKIAATHYARGTVNV